MNSWNLNNPVCECCFCLDNVIVIWPWGHVSSDFEAFTNQKCFSLDEERKLTGTKSGSFCLVGNRFNLQYCTDIYPLNEILCLKLV